MYGIFKLDKFPGTTQAMKGKVHVMEMAIPFAGEISMHYQPGHPHGFCTAIWMGEIALCKVLHDPSGIIAALKAKTVPYPAQLGEALISRFAWEILFAIENGELAVSRDEQTHVSGCTYRALACAAQVLFALNGRYLINEKGALAEAATFPLTIPNLMGLTTQGGAATNGQWRKATGYDYLRIGLSQDVGSIETGKLADLVILDKNPLTDIHNTESINMVMKNGELFEATSLNQVWPVQKPLGTQYWWNTDPK